MPILPTFHPNRSIDDVRFRQIETYLTLLSNYIRAQAQVQSTNVVTNLAEDTATTGGGVGGGTGSIDESQVNWDPDSGHTHDGGDGGTPITMTGDVTGTNTASTVARIRGVNVNTTTPVAGEFLVNDGTNWAIRKFTEGQLGVKRSSNPTAHVHIGAGTATANEAPLKFTSGTDLSVTEDGTVEYDGTRLKHTPKGARRIFRLTSDHITATTTVSNTVTETNLATATLPANSVGTGQTYVFELYGRYSTVNAVDTVTVRFKLSATTVLTITSTAASVTNAPVIYRFVFTFRTLGATGTIWGYIEAEMNSASKTVTATATTTVDTTTAMTPTVTAQWSAADASNSISIDQALLVQSG